jgi:hypothetical protein
LGDRAEVLIGDVFHRERSLAPSATAPARRKTKGLSGIATLVTAVLADAGSLKKDERLDEGSKLLVTNYLMSSSKAAKN